MVATDTLRYIPEGLVVPLALPLEEVDGELQIDQVSLQKLTDYVLEEGSDAVFVLSTTGEDKAQTLRQKHQTLEAVAESVHGLVPLLVGVSSPDITEIKQVTGLANDIGASTVVLAPLIGEGKPEEKLRAVIGETDLPVTLYSNPAEHAGLSLPLRFIDTALADHPQVVAMKDSSDPLVNAEYKRALRERQSQGEFHLLEGNRNMLPSLTPGTAGEQTAMGIASRLLNPFTGEGAVLFVRKDQASMDDITTKACGVNTIGEVKAKLVELGIIRSARVFPPRA